MQKSRKPWPCVSERSCTTS